MIKNFCILAWCLWILISAPFMVFGASNVSEAFIALIVCLFAFAIPAHYLD